MTVRTPRARSSASVAIVAGGATTFGEGIVRAFVEAGASVAIADVDELGDRIAADLPDRVLFTRTDVSVDEDIDRAVEEAEARFGGVDFLVGDFDVIELGACDLEPVVDQFVDDVLAARRLGVRRGQQLGTLLNVELGDRRAIGDDDHLRVRNS